MGEDEDRRRRRRDRESKRRSEERPPLTSQPSYKPETSGRRVRRSDSTEGVAGRRKSSIRIDPEPQYPEAIKTPTTPSAPSRPRLPSRLSGFDDRDDGRDRPSAYREDERRGSKGDWRDYGNAEDTRRRSGGDGYIDSGRGADYSDPRGGQDRGYDDDQDRREGKMRRSSRRDDYRDDDQGYQSSTYPQMDSTERYDSNQRPSTNRDTRDDRYERKKSYDDREDDDRKPDDRLATRRETTLPLRIPQRESRRISYEADNQSSLPKSSLKKPTLRDSGSYQNSGGQLIKSTRLRDLDGWREGQLRAKRRMLKKLREDLKTAFAASSDNRNRSEGDKGWVQEYKWSKESALDKYREDKEGLDHICRDFERRYEDTVDDIHQRYIDDPRKGLPGQDSSVMGTVKVEEKREGCYISSAYTYSVDGNKEHGDGFYVWFPSKRLSDTFVSAVKEVKKGVANYL